MSENVLEGPGAAPRLTALEELELELAEMDENRIGLGPRIWRSWKDMRAATRNLIDEKPSEARLLFFVLLSDIVFFLSMSLKTVVAPPESFKSEIPLSIGLVLIGALFLRTTVMYIFSFILAKGSAAFGGKGTWYDTRVGVFWGAIVAAPFGLLMALITIFMNWLEPTLPILGNKWVALVPYWLGVLPFMWIISQGLSEAQHFKSNKTSFIVLSIVALVVLAGGIFFGISGH